MWVLLGNSAKQQSTYFEVYIQNSTNNTNATLCASYATYPPAQPIKLQCGPIWGQYLRIKKLQNCTNTNNGCYLSLCEVVVFGHQVIPEAGKWMMLIGSLKTVLTSLFYSECMHCCMADCSLCDGNCNEYVVGCQNCPPGYLSSTCAGECHSIKIYLLC